MLSIIVIGKNEAAHLPDCFSSIKRVCSDIPHEIIYVDSGSTDESLSIASQFARCCLVSDPNPTPGLGRRIGSEEAKGDWLLFLDGDMRLENGFLEQAFAAADRTGSAAITGIRHDIYYQAGKKVSENANYFHCITARAAIEFGGALLIRREALTTSLGWSSDTIACEENELHSRLIKYHLHVLELPVPMIIHSDAVQQNRSALSILLNRRHLGQGEAFRCAIAKGSLGAYLRFNCIWFLFYLFDVLSIILLLCVHWLGLPLFCFFQALQLGYYMKRKIIRRYVSQKLFFFYFPAGCLTYHKRSLDYTVLTEGAN